MKPNLSREEIEKEVNEDLSKPEHQLLIDIHQEILRNDRPVFINSIHALKRFSSLMTRSIIATNKSSDENIKLQASIKSLTNLILWLTIIMVIIGALQVFFAYKNLGCSIPM